MRILEASVSCKSCLVVSGVLVQRLDNAQRSESGSLVQQPPTRARSDDGYRHGGDDDDDDDEGGLGGEWAESVSVDACAKMNMRQP